MPYYEAASRNAFAVYPQLEEEEIMIHFLSTAKFSLSFLGIAGGGLLLGAAADTLSSATPITLGEAIAVGSVCAIGALWIGRWLQKVEDRLKELENGQKKQVDVFEKFKKSLGE